MADLALDCIRRKVMRGSESIELAPKEFGILEYMMRNKGRPLSRTMIVEHVWDMDYDGLTNIVDVYIRHLRSKIDDRFPEKLIQTVRGIGYMIEAPEKRCSAEEPGRRPVRVTGLDRTLREGQRSGAKKAYHARPPIYSYRRIHRCFYVAVVGRDAAVSTALASSLEQQSHDDLEQNWAVVKAYLRVENDPGQNNYKVNWHYDRSDSDESVRPTAASRRRM